jgi:hypothetical protein
VVGSGVGGWRGHSAPKEEPRREEPQQERQRPKATEQHLQAKQERLCRQFGPTPELIADSETYRARKDGKIKALL